MKPQIADRLIKAGTVIEITDTFGDRATIVLMRRDRSMIYTACDMAIHLSSIKSFEVRTRQ